MLYANGYPVGGGGGGTGGHTIIDENGNSMTARAGLQFVGGANVSDDETNDKTIVDLASAGGIDGVFIDTENAIYSTSGNATDEYTATEDCFVMADVVTASNQVATVKIDDVLVCEYFYSNVGIGIESYNGYLKKGQTIKVEHGQSQSHTFKVLGIQTGTTHSKFQPVIYSTEEREIGVWTDGKPLYEKTIHTGALSTGANNIAHNVSNIEHLISASGKFVYSTYENVFPFVSIGQNSWNVSFAGDDSTNIIIEVGSSYTSTYAITDSYTTIRYTKTTDVAGSGSWTPQGVPTHHYSTDEQIIGTWIDGSTLYEKTLISNAQVSLSDSVWTTIPMPNDAVPTGLDTKFIVNSFNPNDSDLIQDNRVRYVYDNGVIKGASSQNGQNVPAGLTIVLRYTKSS